MSGSEPTAVDLIRSQPHSTVALVDDAEDMDGAFMEVLGSRLRNGSTVLISVEQNHLDSSFGSTMEELRHLHRTDILPLPLAQIATIVHAHSPVPLDTTTVNTISRLSQGRPGWALDMTRIATHGRLSVGPPVTFDGLSRIPDPLPSVRRTMRLRSILPEHAIAAAIALAEIDPLDLTTSRLLLGEATVEALQRSGVLLPDKGSALHRVPEFVAATLRSQVQSDLVDEVRVTIARALVAQETLGFPLSERDTQFCSQVFNAEDLDRAERRILGRALSTHVTYGDAVQTRSILLRFGGRGLELHGLARVRSLIALGSDSEALQTLQELGDDESRDPHVAYLRALLDTSETRDAPDQHTADWLFKTVNQTELTGTDVEGLATVAATHPDVAVATLAASMYALEQVLEGRVPPTGLTPPVWKIKRDEQDLANACLVAQSLTMMLSGEFSTRESELFQAAQRLPDPRRHKRWIRHLVAAGHGLVSGDLARSTLEWNLFREHIPRFLPGRIIAILDSVGEALRGPVPPVPSTREGRPCLVHRFVLYQREDHETLLHLLQRHPGDDETLPLIQLVKAHLVASHREHPGNLVRVGDQFAAFGLWLFAVRAYGQAKSIYLKRRATGLVTHSHEKMEHARKQLLAVAPWLHPTEVAVSKPTRLTNRERETAELVARGLSNREIADHLGCTVRTVESHVASARAKLGATNRRELGRLFSGQDQAE